MKTTEYLAEVRQKTGYTDYRIAKELNTQTSLVSRYNLSKTTLSEKHAFQLSEILGKNPAKVIADTKLEHAEKINDEKKIAFWRRQVKRLSSGLLTVFSVCFLSLSPADELLANHQNDNSHNNNYTKLMMTLVFICIIAVLLLIFRV